MPRYKLIIEYDGTPFVGWQAQDNGASVQGVLADAIAAFAGERVTVSGAGRTDAGVHALGQVASFTLESPIPVENLALAFWERVRSALPEGSLRSVRLWETDKNWAEVGDHV